MVSRHTAHQLIFMTHDSGEKVQAVQCDVSKGFVHALRIGLLIYIRFEILLSQKISILPSQRFIFGLFYHKQLGKQTYKIR